MTRVSLANPVWRGAFLCAAWLALSAFACPIFCTEQTNIQVGYNEDRDNCRDYAETKLSGMYGDSDEAMQKARLVALFSECMKTKGWDVPGPANAENVLSARGSILPSPAPMNGSAKSKEAAPAAGPANQAGYGHDELQRAADCAWARQNAPRNQVAAIRAQACDIECRQRLEANPYGLRPAACGPEYPEDRVRKRMIGNMEGEIPPAAGTPEPKKKTVKKKVKKKAPAKKVEPAPVPVPEEKPASTACEPMNAQTVLDRALESGTCAK